MQTEIIARLKTGNRCFMEKVDKAVLQDLTKGQHPYAIVICCSDSRVVPEELFSAELGELFVIRVAGNVLDRHQLGSIEYAAAHLHCPLVLMLGHTGCGAVEAAVSGAADGFIASITEEILNAAGSERDRDKACRLNVLHGVKRIRDAFLEHPEIGKIDVRGAVYHIETGETEWLEEPN